MNVNKHKLIYAYTVCAIALASFSNLAAARSISQNYGFDPQSDISAPATGRTAIKRHETAAKRHVTDAVAVVRRLEALASMRDAIQQAKGIFVVPTYGRAALAVGGRGGSGVLLVKKEDGTWSEPAFYNISGIGIGAQAGAQAGPIAMVLNNDKALAEFMKKNNFSLSADAGITVVNWSKMAEGSVGTGDVLVWSGTKGLFGDVLTVGINDIRFNRNLTRAYYGQNLTAQEVVTGKAKNIFSDPLKHELASITIGTSSSGSQGGSDNNGADDSGK